MCKKLATLCILALTIILASCAPSSPYSYEDGIVRIHEYFFVTMFNKIMNSRDEHIGRTIQYEGIFASFVTSGGETLYTVYRNAPGCCSPSESLGFEVYLADIEPVEDDAWVEVTGVFEVYEYLGFEFVRLNVVSLIELEERGQELVSR